MTAATETSQPSAATRSRWSRVLYWLGWSLIVAGAVVLLYVVYSLLFTNLETDRAQARLLEEWLIDVPVLPQEGDAGSETEATVGTDREPPEPAAREGRATEPPALGTAVAMIEFVRPGADEPVVHADPLLVVHGVSVADLRQGPGHYPQTALPGADGNFAVAGHRTTYGAPFFSLDELEPGDEIHVTDRTGTRHVYEFVAAEVVRPSDTWVIGDDPLDGGRPTLTLTTCHPRFSAAKRLVVFAGLVS